ncbi:MAG: DUF4258 domain-containing protein [Candidatus Brocadiae bacterium]|nr:DUF4258 domain-containing protein [Candidatus Brocadiia bacterium]
MDQEKLKSAIEQGLVQWQKHALERMLMRNISRELVKQIILSGEVIKDYIDDKPFPSALILGWKGNRPIHVVIALDETMLTLFVITVYEPDLEHFESDYKTRRKL